MKMPLWTWVLPVLALGALLIASTAGVGPWLAMLCGGALVGAVLVAVHHAEVVAHRLGEPFGTLVLALAVTAIEADADEVAGVNTRAELSVVEGIFQRRARLAAMEAGELEVTVFQDAVGQGGGGIEAAVKLANGETVETDQGVHDRAEASLRRTGYAADLLDRFRAAFQRVENFAVHSCANNKGWRVSEAKLH